MRRASVCGLAVLLGAALLTARFAPADVDNVPVDRLIGNLEQQLATDPRNADLIVNLARVHAMAFASKRDRVPSVDSGGKPMPWLGQGVPAYTQFPVRTTSDPAAQEAARRHLDQAIGRYREALALAPDHLVAKLGLGWALVQAGDRAGAVAVLREVVAAAWRADQKPNVPGPMHGQRFLTEEAIRYLIPLLDPVKDREEIAELKQRAGELERRMRWITPIAVPLQDALTAYDIADDDAAVVFDADGSGIPKRWTWIRSNAAWLVFDRRGTGRVTSALQLFGGVTFWLFWPTGYHPLGALDDDGDGEIRGGELTGLALWHDRNGNGVSERGEVRPVGEWGIVALDCAYTHDPTHPDEIAVAARGVTFRDGTTRPTYDLILRTAR
jgi:tetratricopeptide (TPR) repeat protein